MDFWCFEGKTLRRSGSHDPAMAWAATQEREALPSWGITTTWLRSLEKSWLQQPFFLCKVQIWNDGTLWDILWGNMIYYRIHNIYIISYYIILYYIIVYIYIRLWVHCYSGIPLPRGEPMLNFPPSTISCLGKLCLAFSTLTVSYWNHGPSK